MWDFLIGAGAFLAGALFGSTILPPLRPSARGRKGALEISEACLDLDRLVFQSYLSPATKTAVDVLKASEPEYVRRLSDGLTNRSAALIVWTPEAINSITRLPSHERPPYIMRLFAVVHGAVDLDREIRADLENQVNRAHLD